MSPHTLRRRARTTCGLAALVTLLCSCVTHPVQQQAGVLDFLYPNGSTATAPQDVRLDLPLRVGVAFAPAATGQWPPPASSGITAMDRYEPVFGSAARVTLLQRVAEAFRATSGVARIEVIPDTYLRPGGGFDNVDQLRAMFGIDLLAVISYQQSQVNGLNGASLAYLTLVGAALVKGNEQETVTFVDVSVFAVQARALLFQAAGTSRVDRSTTALHSHADLRSDGEAGFAAAVDDAVAKLAGALDTFRAQARTGTVRGPGTPGLTVTGAGALGGGEALVAALALAAARVLRRRGRHPAAQPTCATAA